MTSFDPHRFAPAVAALVAESRLNPLDGGKPNEVVRTKLDGLAIDSAWLPYRITDRAMADACRAGLYLYHNFLDESHAISQELSGPIGSFWHAVMHRREPDADNSKYWWRRVGSHPVLRQLVEQAPGLGYRFTDPFAFVDFVERVRDAGTPEEEMAKRVQLLEWHLLFDWCYQRALAGAESV